MWEWEFLEIEFERGWNCDNDLKVRDLKKRLSCKNWDFGSWILREIRIVSYLRNRNYESWCVKIGNLRNHSKAEFIEIMNKMIMIMIIISSGINTRIGAWETEN